MDESNDVVAIEDGEDGDDEEDGDGEAMYFCLPHNCLTHRFQLC